ncbi:esterase/lipase family protein [Tenacibaculum sp. TC6]|uniref:esterase/lipase family protein n=1 Tax=Tenacibaculum sp. TC6 TaxID=3423223 RepID=UPI003D36670D
MKRILLWLVFVIYTTLTTAQEEINTTFANQMNTLFGQLNKSKVPKGILLDMAMEFTDVPAFNGTLSSQNYVSAQRLKEIYKTLLMGRITEVSSGFVAPDVLDEQWFNQRTDTHIALAGLYFAYGRFISNATNNGKLTYSNGKFYDKYVNGVWQNPYETLKTFALTTPIQVYTGLQLQVKLPQALLYTNSATEILKIEADFADGRGYRLLPYNQLVSVNYTQEGNKIWKYKLTLTNGQVLYSHSKIIIKNGVNAPFKITNVLQKSTAGNDVCNLNETNGIRFFDIQSSQSYLGQPGKARIFVDYANKECKITKPLIVVEGWDFSTLLSPETRHSSDDFNKFKTSVEEGASNLRTLLIGDPRKLNDQKYDLIYVNWHHGMDYIQRNALVVEEVIKWVNQQKALSGSTEKNVIIGQSMGGVVCRYALRDMEQRNLTHQVRLFVSQDSPQQGANIPLSIQYMYRNLRNQVVQAPLYTLIRITTLQDPAYKYFSLLDQPATRQMLVNRSNNNYAIDNTTHTNFYNELNNKGYPSQNGIRNIAMSNGSECGSTQNFNAGDFLINYNYSKSLSFLQDLASLIVIPVGGALAGSLVDYDFFKVGILGLLPGNSKFSVILQDRALYPTGGNKIHHFQITYTKKILWLIPVTTSIVNKQINQPSFINKHYDNFGGGFIDIGTYIGKLNINGLSINDKFTIVPTPSALGISATSNNDFKTSYVGAFPPVSPLNTPFQNFTTAFKATNNPNNNNERHLEFTARNGNWLASELSNVVKKTDCSAFCSDSTIQGKNVLCSSETYSLFGGATPNWSISKGADLVNYTISNNSINLSKKTSSSTGEVILTATVGNLECGQRTLTKKIWVNKPNITTQLEPIGSNYVKVLLIGDNNTNIYEQGITSTKWEVISRSGGCYGSFGGSGFEGLGNGNCTSWRVHIKITATNACGSTIIYRDVTPPAPEPCESRLAFKLTEKNSYSVQRIIEDPCSNKRSFSSSKQSLDNAQINAYDIYGNLIESGKRNILNLNDRKNGVYILHSNIDGVIVKKIIVKKE